MKIRLILVILGTILVALMIFLVMNKEAKKLELTYKINAGIPYRWEFEIEDESIVKFSNSYILEDQNKKGVTGAPVYTNYVFEGLKEGKTTITFKFVNFTNNTVEKEEKHIVRVDKNKNISLVGVK